ncbi:MAG: M3 family peptidase, partial [Gemmatimonadetes bacterium]|nr:M3 family metallopeptidase [Gemmatimonadota bacterium]NIQ56885.1 M3 family metallopeptidase [Gemmatimonadota bacterium]NIU77062.1 M3 family peptidase [Gammaproteobacteria bacterium]NIX46403.1 M3 family peptidase [Gemmatimonadota bacterium]NIY10712.1 M3 family peptidase [Gemmatimonadota bacterium]
MIAKRILPASAALIALAACAGHTPESAESMQQPEPEPAAAAAAAGEPAAEEAATVQADNPLLAEWTGPYGGVPAFDAMELEDLPAALDAAMAEELGEIDAITADPEPATFENTIVPLERAGGALDRVMTYYGIWSSNRSSPEFRAIQAEYAPKLSEHSTRIIQNDALFRRVKAVYEGDEMATLRPDQRRVVELIYDGFARNGATLTGEAKARYAAINERLAELHTAFANNVLADEEGYVTYLTEDQLGGLP